MEIEFWWLLALPLFFGLGWLAARIDIRQVVQESRALPRSYLSGLNFLLNEQPDKAIDAFVEAVRIDPQTVELHFAADWWIAFALNGQTVFDNHTTGGNGGDLKERNGMTDDAFRRMMEWTIRDIRRLENGEELINVVNK